MTNIVTILIFFATAQECLHWRRHDISSNNHITSPLQWGMWSFYVSIEEFMSSVGW